MKLYTWYKNTRDSKNKRWDLILDIRNGNCSVISYLIDKMDITTIDFRYCFLDSHYKQYNVKEFEENHTPLIQENPEWRPNRKNVIIKVVFEIT